MHSSGGETRLFYVRLTAKLLFFDLHYISERLSFPRRMPHAKVHCTRIILCTILVTLFGAKFFTRAKSCQLSGLTH
jgi:hypothetical protein